MLAVGKVREALLAKMVEKLAGVCALAPAVTGVTLTEVEATLEPAAVLVLMEHE